MLRSVHADLQLVHECRRPFTRYFIFRHTYFDPSRPHFAASNGKLCYQALSKLVNSLSWGPDTGGFFVGDPEGASICRIDLRDFQWDSKTWERILADYPYGVLLNDPTARSVSDMTRCRLPYVRGDWFIFAASRPPLYHDVLGIPKTQAELESMLRIDVVSDIQRGRVARSGFRRSGVSKHNRLVEWHKTGYGAFWKSYDFSSSSGRADLFAHPTGPAWGNDDSGFRNAGGEIIFTLPNHLHAYMLVDASGNRLDKAPIEIVADSTNQRDPAIVNGISCMGCHSEGFKAVPTDEVRAHVNAALKDYSKDEIANVQALHPSKETMDGLVTVLNQMYARTVEPMGGTSSDPIQRVSSLYQSEVSLETAAAEFGVTADQLRIKINESSPTVKRTLAAILNQNGSVHREALVFVFPDIVRDWKLGESYAAAALLPSGQPSPTASEGEQGTNEEGYQNGPPTRTAEPFDPLVFWGVGLTILVFVPGALLFVVFRKRTHDRS